jgi:hypothetical protein
MNASIRALLTPLFTGGAMFILAAAYRHRDARFLSQYY